MAKFANFAKAFMSLASLAKAAAAIKAAPDIETMVHKIEGLVASPNKMKLAAPDKNDPLSVAISGEATAVGKDTLAQGTIKADVVDHGAVSVAKGTTVMTATAESPKGTTAFATATSDVDVSGADIVLKSTKVVTTTTVINGQDVVTETSTTKFIAIDFERFDFLGGPLIIDRSLEVDAKPLAKPAAHKPSAPDLDPIDLDGNVAILDVDVVAQGDNSLAEVDASVLTVNDQLSTVQAYAVLAVG